MAYSASSGEDLYEIYVSPYPTLYSKKISQITEQIQNWKVAKSEVISWKSKDGRVIEGVLHKPQDYDPQ